MLLSVSFWNNISVLACMIAVSMDPLFFYITFLDHDKKCLGMDKRLRTAVLITRSLTDFSFLFHSVYEIREAVKAVDFVSQRGNSKLFNWFGHAKAIAKKLSWSSFLTDIFAIIPIPHVLILALFYAPNFGFSKNKMNLDYMLLVQYVPRMCRIFISSRLFRKNSSVWLKVAFYFFMYILSSHVIGAFWYFSSIQIQAVCWHLALRGRDVTFQCDGPPLSVRNREIIKTMCKATKGEFDYGSFLDTIKADQRPKTLRQKLFYFVWWGLKNLSNYGTNIGTSKYIWDNCFAILVSGIGLVLFALLIGHMQESMQSSEEKKVATEKVQMKEQELQEWMDKNGLPEKLGKDATKLRIEVMTKITENLKDDKNAEVQNLFSLIPWNTVKDLKLSVCMSMLKKVRRLKNMDERELRLICQYLKPVTYTEKTIAFRMGEPLDSMLFIMEGIMLIYPTSTTNTTTADHQVGRANIRSPSTIRGSLESGDVYGDELLSWASPPDMSDISYTDLPILTENVKCLSEVEGFILTAKDLKYVVSMYKLQGNYNSSSHLVEEVERSISREEHRSMICREHINPTPWPGTDQGGDEETGIQESNN
ncbi:cyclic nucleotide-gated ion channel 1-like isoform X2 [Rosa rugosa]|nr:cyclic nucleotide-gated ion channel 1-like isoform X2 [Rosa rugosa]